MKVVGVLSEKGGVGKTTIAVHLARGLQIAGFSVLVVDTDPQGSASDWVAAAPGDVEMPTVVGMNRAAQLRDISRVGAAFDWVVVDGAPKIEELAAAAVRACDYVIIPAQPSPLDIWASGTLVEMVRTRHEITDGRPRAQFLISRRVGGTKLAAEVVEAIRGYGFPVMEGSTTQRVAYPTAASLGRTVLDMEPGGPAAAEVTEITQEVLSWP